MKIKIYLQSDVHNYNASGTYDTVTGNVTIFKGSKIRVRPEHKYKRNQQAEAYRNDRKIVSNENILLKDIILTSPSTASQFVVDASSDGLNFWKTEKKISLKKALEGEK